MNDQLDSISGVNYGLMDPSKRSAIAHARKTASILEGHTDPSPKMLEWTYGESVSVQQWGHWAVGHVIESLGTKNLVADAMRKITGHTYYDQLAQDTVAMAVNDMITLGVIPTSIMMLAASGSSSWFADNLRMHDLQKGFKNACQGALAAWGGGESPALKKIVEPDRAVLACSANGRTSMEALLNPDRIQAGDAIIFLPSGGIMSNGLTSARELGEILPDAFETRLSDGRMYGEALLDPTPIFVRPIWECLRAYPGAIRYGVNITGHGLRKLMRAQAPFCYRITQLPEIPPVLAFLQACQKLTDRDAYGTYNMGVGFALYVDAKACSNIIRVLERMGCNAFRAGTIESSKKRKVILSPIRVTYHAKELDVR